MHEKPTTRHFDKFMICRQTKCLRDGCRWIQTGCGRGWD